MKTSEKIKAEIQELTDGARSAFNREEWLRNRGHNVAADKAAATGARPSNMVTALEWALED